MKLIDIADRYADRIRDPRVSQMFRQCFMSTFDTTVKHTEDGDCFVITGDIPAMWLRDSSAQVNHYVRFAAESREAYDLVLGLLRRQVKSVRMAPYANAYNESPNGACWSKDRTLENPAVWEHKYEIDSLCYPIRLAYRFWKCANTTEQFDEGFRAMLDTVLDLWTLEQHHENSPYYFERTNCPPSDTLTNDGKGTPVGYTGMTWSGFRPSDDACKYGYLIPSNFFAATVLGYTMEIAREVYRDTALESRAAVLREQILAGIREYATFDHPTFGTIYAYEVDGLGNQNFMDDANVPSLLALPYLGCLDAEDPIYRNTRRFVLSQENPYYYEGSAAKGIGSPHTPERYVWPIALSIQGLTERDSAKVLGLINTLTATDAGTGFMHEGFCVDDPRQFTRDWFSWANTLFAEVVMCYLDAVGSL